ncbi:Inositol polyphosphate1phosphatase [Caligus rogercresseyi]|uniref:Inositol polyphosphate1phosphatase n=1 Tax=Caligus rogercresseyi TaxID=217165 RepID=A0A7T8KDD3_CALRO|nr:Inositol polyphosphate1phosphatase [Caligus rogercresseyi]
MGHLRGQGILSSLGGGIVEFLGDGDLNNVEEVAEVEGPAKWRNANGIIAYRDKAALHDLQLAIHEFLSNQNPQNP